MNQSIAATAATVRVPEDFQIYTTMAGASIVTSELHAACEALKSGVVATLECGGDVGANALNRLLREHVVPVLRRHRDFGTLDSEPSTVIVAFLRRLLMALRLINDFGWYDLRDRLII